MRSPTPSPGRRGSYRPPLSAPHGHTGSSAHCSAGRLEAVADRVRVLRCRSRVAHENGKFRHHSFTERFFHWPEQTEEAVTWAIGEGAFADLYVCPVLRLTKSRKKMVDGHPTAGPGRWLWCDVDGLWTAEREARWSTSPPPAGPSPSSGRGRHLYVYLSTDRQPADLERLNRRLRDTLDGDHKWDSSAYLRLPGTYNFKPLAVDGSAPAPVVVL